jgi:transcriptional regulator with XRE-family HTH domain
MESKRLLSENLQDYLSLHKRSAADLGEECGCGNQYIYKIKNCKVNPSLEMIDKLASAMGCTQADLFTEGYFSKFETKIVKKKAK